MFIGIMCKRMYKGLFSNFYLLTNRPTPYKYKRKLHAGATVRPNKKIYEPAKFIKTSEETFDSQVEKRRQQAQRSVLVQVQSEQSYNQLHDYCSQFGNVVSMHHYTTTNSTTHFILLELSSSEIVSEVIKACGHNDRGQVIPTQSRMLWFRANQKKKLTNSTSPSSVPLRSGAPPLARTQLEEWLDQAETISDQITILHRATQLDELGVRLRYVTAHQLEAAVSGLFPRARVQLFGSSVNGFGRQGCDLDLVMQLDSQSVEEDNACRLVFHAKPSTHARSQVQRYIDGLGDLVQWCLPGCTDVRRILLARVPIVKYRQELTDIECDLSLTNMTAVYMSELLYTYGAIDPRLRPLVFSVKRWAAEVGLTNPSPGRWVTNFSLTLLVIFYMQREQILPSLDTLRQLAGKADKRISEDGVNCTFLRNPAKVSPSSNSASLESLLLGFFEYYAAFDFATQGLGLGPGAPVKKRDHSALYITNPLENNLNVSQNVSLEETERLKMEFRNASWELESSMEDESQRSGEWGLLRLYKENKNIDKARHLEHLYFTPKRRPTGRLMTVSKLFEEDPEENNGKRKTSRSLEHNVR